MTPEALQLITAFISGLGFPIFVAVYLLIAFRRTLTDNTAATKDLSLLIRSWMASENPPHSTTTPPKPPQRPN